MVELDPLIAEYSHEKQRPRESEALHTLRKIASLVKPIMRARNWRVGTLAEFYPPERNLLGVNWNKGQKICLRLRYPGDANQFLPTEQVVDTMLHELSHNVFGEHDAKFHALWNQLREEYEGLLRKGYTGEGFLSEGNRLGGRRVPMDEARRIARNAAEKRRTLTAGSGQRLGGGGIRPGEDVRSVIVSAIDRRSTVMKGCSSGTKNDKEIKALADEATSNGFRTKAEEDEANDLAIAQALWEMVQEEEKEKYGDAYIPPTAANPTGNGGGDWGSLTKEEQKSTAGSSNGSKRPGPSSSLPREPRHISRLVPQEPPKPNLQTKPTRPSTSRPSVGNEPPPRLMENTWECEICTCHNKITYLCCDACGTERPTHTSRKIAEAASRSEKARTAAATSKTWICHRCSTVMEDKWWTCSTCATMKLSS